MRIAGSMLTLSLMLAACAPSRQLIPMVSDPVQRSGSATRAAMGEALGRGDRAEVTARATQLAAMGGTLSDAGFAQIRPLLDDPELIATATVSALGANGDPIEGLHAWFAHNADPAVHAGRPTLAATVPADYRLVEGIAWDGARERLFVATVIDGRLAYLDRDGSWHEVTIGTPRAGLFGMAVDVRRRLLWIATGAVPQVAVPAEQRMTGLIAVDLDRLEVVRRVPVPADATGSIGDLAIAADGTVYTSDSLKGAIYRCAPGCAVLSAMLPEGSFVNPQGLALLDGDRTLFIADYKTGLWRITPGASAPAPVSILAPAMLEGIDGLIRADDSCLIAIQNGTRPRRIAKICRLRGGEAFVVWAHSVFPADSGEATLGSLAAEGTLWFVADSQWERYGEGGAITDGKPARSTPIHSVPIREPGSAF